VPPILVADPSLEIRELVEHVVARLGYEPLRPAQLNGSSDDLAAAVVEPADPASLLVACTLRANRAELPLVLHSPTPKNDASRALRRSAYLVKPFRLGELMDALAAAVSSAERPGR
jgi:DNA-binding response OmpR family regulator